jgi:8-oxo-dGTP diphosphatase
VEIPKKEKRLNTNVRSHRVHRICGGILMKVCAGGILVKDNKILLGKRSHDLTFYPGVWDIIGGHCRHGELLEQALSRELREEIGITPTEFTHIAVLSDPESDIHGVYEYHVFMVTEWIGSPRNRTDEHSELGWFTVQEAVGLNLAHPHYCELFKNIKTVTVTKK